MIHVMDVAVAVATIIVVAVVDLNAIDVSDVVDVHIGEITLTAVVPRPVDIARAEWDPADRLS